MNTLDGWDTIEFTIPGVPVPEARARSVPTKGGIRAMTPKKTRDWKALVSICASTAVNGRPPATGPILLAIEVYIPRPKRLGKGPACYAPTRGDWDNYGKGVSDGMNGIVYVDDRQVVRGTVEKWYHGSDAGPRLRVEVHVRKETADAD